MTARNQKQIDSGGKAELRFKKLMQFNGIRITESTEEENINQHIDFHLNGTTVDVKCMKKISRSDPEPQDTYVWVEFMNVNGKPGWLYGKAEYIAFEMKDGFAMVEREKLIQHCNSVVDKKTSVDNPEEALNKVYRRSGRKDSMTLLLLADIPYVKVKEP